MKLFQIFNELFGRKDANEDEDIQGHIETVKAKLDWDSPPEIPKAKTPAATSAKAKEAAR